MTSVTKRSNFQLEDIFSLSLKSDLVLKLKGKSHTKDEWDIIAEVVSS